MKIPTLNYLYKYIFMIFISKKIVLKTYNEILYSKHFYDITCNICNKSSVPLSVSLKKLLRNWY